MTADDSPPADVAAEEHGLSPREVEVVAAVVSGLTWADTALLTKVSESTVARIMRSPVVRAAVADLRTQRAHATADALDRMVSDALDTLTTLTTGPDTGEAVRLRAALGVLDQARRWRDHADLADRVYELECLARERGDLT